jgi:hypothetical protein
MDFGKGSYVLFSVDKSGEFKVIKKSENGRWFTHGLVPALL